MLLLALLACPNDNKVSVYKEPPTAAIDTPVSGSSAPEETVVSLTGRVLDRETDPDALLVQWSSTLDGVLVDDLPPSADGTVNFPVSTLSVGTHLLKMTVTDEDGQQGSAEVTFTIDEVPDNPEISVVHPLTGEEARDDEAFTFAASVRDNQDAADLLLVDVTSETSGVVCSATPDGLGAAECDAVLSAGTHYLTFRVTDTDGLYAEAGAAIVVRSHLDIDDDGDGFTENQNDCDDTDDTVGPLESESVNGADDDCDGLVDDGTTAYDDDADGFTEVGGDCDDADATSYPGGTEVVDGADNDCDGVLENDTELYDDDGDGYTEAGGDCDDADLTTYPSAAELEDAIDNDCDSIVDEGTNAYDDDGDGLSENSGDCDDADPATYPGAEEDLSDSIDQDCNGVSELDLDSDGYISAATGGNDCDDGDFYTHPYIATLEADPALCYTDADGDGYGDDNPVAAAEVGDDCDDGDDTINPDGTESCDGVDNDCDGSTDERNADGCTTYYYDYDGDGYGSDSVSGVCYCDPTGYYTAAYDTDCYDYNASANPSDTTYHTTNRGDSSYDWDCDGTQEKYWKTAGSCSGWPLCSGSDGWQSSVASCGTTASYITACGYSSTYTSCKATTSSYTQKCR